MSIKGGYWVPKEAENSDINDIPVNHFTHISYAYVGVDDKNYQLDINEQEKKKIAQFSRKFGKGNSRVKAILSIGGLKSDGTHSKALAKIAGNETHRTMFIESAIDAATEYRFDGLELSWQFPKTQQEMRNMGFLLKEWKDIINERKLDLIFSASVFFKVEIPRQTGKIKYPVEEIKNNLDFINLVAYDYFPATVPHAQVRADSSSGRTTDDGIRSWTDAGILSDKLVMGIPLYGHKWILANEDDKGFGAPVTGFDSFVPYNKIPKNPSTYDSNTISEYVAVGTDWYGFDGEKSMKEKVIYANGKRLRGYFLYHIAQDDDDFTLSKTASNA